MDGRTLGYLIESKGELNGQAQGKVGTKVNPETSAGEFTGPLYRLLGILDSRYLRSKFQIPRRQKSYEATLAQIHTSTIY